MTLGPEAPPRVVGPGESTATPGASVRAVVPELWGETCLGVHLVCILGTRGLAPLWYVVPSLARVPV